MIGCLQVQHTNRIEIWQQEEMGKKQSGNEQTWEKETGKEQIESCNQKSSEEMLLVCYVQQRP